MRLINADALYEYITNKVGGVDCAVLLDNEIAPTIDAVEVVRCKDCKHRRENCGMGDHRWCDVLKMTTMEDDFCSYGERKGGDDECRQKTEK